jgi:hypothetical protein
MLIHGNGSFVRYMFRVSNFDNHQGQEIFNLQLRSDENIMIRHILYPVSLLQRETAPPDLNSNGASDEEEDEPSDYDDGDEEDYPTMKSRRLGTSPMKVTKTTTGIVSKMPQILTRSFLSRPAFGYIYLRPFSNYR